MISAARIRKLTSTPVRNCTPELRAARGLSPAIWAMPSALRLSIGSTQGMTLRIRPPRIAKPMACMSPRPNIAPAPEPAAAPESAELPSAAEWPPSHGLELNPTGAAAILLSAVSARLAVKLNACRGALSMSTDKTRPVAS